MSMPIATIMSPSDCVTIARISDYIIPTLETGRIINMRLVTKVSSLAFNLKRYPSKQEILASICASWTCTCSDVMSRYETFRILAILIKEDSTRFWTCCNILMYDALKTSLSRTPTMVEFLTYERNYNDLMTNYDEYNCKTKIKVGALIDKFVTNAENSDKEDMCGICCENFKVGERISKLPCTHKFHLNESCTVQKWFDEHIHCPLCRQDLRDMDSGVVSFKSSSSSSSSS